MEEAMSAKIARVDLNMLINLRCKNDKGSLNDTEASVYMSCIDLKRRRR